MKRTILLTIGFPFDNYEPFISNELQFSKDLIIVSSYIGKSNFFEKNKLQGAILWHCSSGLFKGNKFLFFLKSLGSLFSKCFWKELFGQDIKPLRFKKVRQLISAITKARAIYSYCCKQIKKESMQNDSFVFYSYWMNQLGVAAVMLRKKFGGIAVSRCHGYDLYQRKENNYYVSFQKYLSNSLDYVFPISIDGEQIIKKNIKSNNDSKIILSRLGTFDCGLNPNTKQSDVFVVVSCSNVVELKRVDLIFDTLRKLKFKKIVWHHFGDGPELNKIDSLVKTTKCELVTFLHGRTSNQFILDFYRNNHVDLFVNLSISEGIPVSIMEAQSFGIPCFATDVGGTHEIVNNDNGWLVHQDLSSDQIASIINQIMLMRPNEIENKRIKSRLFWENGYNANTNFSKFYIFLESGYEKKD